MVIHKSLISIEFQRTINRSETRIARNRLYKIHIRIPCLAITTIIEICETSSIYEVYLANIPETILIHERVIESGKLDKWKESCSFCRRQGSHYKVRLSDTSRTSLEIRICLDIGIRIRPWSLVTVYIHYSCSPMVSNGRIQNIFGNKCVDTYICSNIILICSEYCSRRIRRCIEIDPDWFDIDFWSNMRELVWVTHCYSEVHRLTVRNTTDSNSSGIIRFFLNSRKWDSWRCRRVRSIGYNHRTNTRGGIDEKEFS